MRLIDVIELYFERCGLLYGQGLCQAALGITGDRYCFNSLNTCQSFATFDADGPETPEVPAGSGAYVNRYIQTLPGTANNFTATISMGALPPVGSNRRVVLGLELLTVSATQTVTGVTIGGVTATINQQQNSSNSIAAIVSAQVNTDANLTVVVTCSGNIAYACVAVFRLLDATATPTATAVNTADPLNFSVNIGANSFVIGIGVSSGGSANTWTGLTERHDEDIAPGIISLFGTAASATFADAETSYAIACDNAGSPSYMSGVVAVFELRDFVPAIPSERAGTTAMHRFARATDGLHALGLDAIPTIEAINYTPPMIHPGEDTGQRATLSVQFRDHRWADTGPNGDLYRELRGGDPYSQGTYWGKFRARQYFVRGRAIKRYQGLAETPFDTWPAENFVMERAEGPTPDGAFTITARDPMQSLFSDRSQCPRPSRGTLIAGINASVTTATLAPAGIGDEEYPSVGWLTFSGSEIVQFTRTGDALTFVRARWGTTAEAHEAGARVQLCCDDFISVTPDFALARLMTEYGDVPASAINTDDWASEVAAYYTGELLTTLIAEPTPTERLANEIIREVGLSTWWDAAAARQRLQVIREIDTDALLLDARNAPGEGNVIAGSLSIREQPEKRISRAEVWYGQVNPLEGIEPKNLPALALRVATEEEASEGSPAIDTIYSRWIQSGGLPSANAIASKRLARFVRAPRRFTVNLPRWGTIQPVLGQGCRLLLDVHQTDEGGPETVPCQIISIDPGANGGAEYGLVLEEIRFNPKFQPEIAPNTVVLEYSQNNVNFHERFRQRYPDLEAGETATLIINEGVVIGSTDIALPALDIGTGWAVGVNLVVINRGTISGRGGLGGRGSGGDNNNGGAGGAGGLAFKTTVPFTLQGTGKVQGGGGGGGGGAGDYVGWTGPQVNGAGGGGGAGAEAGAGGPAAGNAGFPGSLLAGGAGRPSSPSSQGWGSGAGGSPGAAGSSAYGYRPGAGGAAGPAIDGWSHVTLSSWTGTIAGATIN